MLDHVLGRNKMEVTLSLRSQCPYIDATLMEIQRFASLAPIALFHATTTDTHFRGFKIAKDALVLWRYLAHKIFKYFLDCVPYDQELWLLWIISFDQIPYKKIRVN